MPKPPIGTTPPTTEVLSFRNPAINLGPATIDLVGIKQQPDMHTAIPPVTIEVNPRYYSPDAEKLMRERGIITESETVEDALERTTSALLEIDSRLNGAYDPAFASDVTNLIQDGVIVYGTPVLTNASRNDKVTAACTVLPVELRNGQLDMGSFYEQSNRALSDAVGTGYDLSELSNPADAIVEMNNTLNKINSRLVGENKRPVASMATLRADHPDVRRFIAAKNHADFSKWRFNLSVFVTEELFEKAKAGELWELRDEDGTVVDALPASELLREIAECANYCGEPGILFKDRIDYDNPTPQWEYKSTAPCAEVAMAEGEACQFSYINLANLTTPDGEFDYDGFSIAVRTMTRLLDASVEHTVAHSRYGEFELAAQKRRIGVGITGFADLLVRLKIPYDSSDAVKMAARISEVLDYQTKDASADLAITRGSFSAYDQSRYTDSSWVERKLPRSKGGVSPENWKQLSNKILSTGIRHSSTTSMPPTGTSSTIVAASQSLEPLFALRDRQGGLPRSLEETLSPDEREDITNALLANGTLDPAMLERFPYLRTARQLPTLAHLNVQTAFQSFLDESLAKTVNMDHGSTVEDVIAVLYAAYAGHLKGITVFRDGCLSERTITR